MTFHIADDDLSAELSLGAQRARLLKDHFREPETEAARRELFKSSVSNVVLETSSSCNRRCGFCPNAKGSRLKGQNRMPDHIFTKVINNLSDIDYDKSIMWHLYNEPMQDMDHLYKNLSYARKHLPHATFRFNTNGDYLNPTTLERIREAGCNHIYVSIYGPNHGEWSNGYVVSRIRSLVRSLNISGKMSYRPDREYTFSAWLDGFSIVISAKNLWVSGYDRGGLIDGLSIRRSTPCLSPVNEFLVDHRGNVIPCCNVYADDAAHQPYIVTNLREGDIFSAYAGLAMRRWRAGVLAFDLQGALCGGCSRGEVAGADTPENRERLNRLRQRLGADLVQ